MSSTNDVRVFGATQIAVGLSQLVAIRPSANQAMSTIKILSGAGTLWISPVIGVSLSGAAAASLVGQGYPLGLTEVLTVPGPATFYMAAGAATMIAAVVNGYTTGYTLIA